MPSEHTYEPTAQSLSQHKVPEWFKDAKLGIFVTWDVYSVPGWAPLTGEMNQVIAERGWEYWFLHNPDGVFILHLYSISFGDV